jgi:hypothetical protein
MNPGRSCCVVAGFTNQINGNVQNSALSPDFLGELRTVVANPTRPGCAHTPARPLRRQVPQPGSADEGSDDPTPVPHKHTWRRPAIMLSRLAPI